MGTVFKPFVTRPLTEGAQLVTRAVVRKKKRFVVGSQSGLTPAARNAKPR
jgi:hypothetical protein